MMECNSDKFSWFDATNQLQARAAQHHIPLTGTFELTARCNLGCKMCYIRNSGDAHCIKQKEKTAAQWIDMGRQAAENGTLFLLLTGGEPFLRPDFQEIYKALAQMGFILSIYTNGTLLTERTMEWLSAMPPGKIAVTLYGASPQTYQQVTGDPYAYEKTLQGIDLLLDAGIETQLRMTVTKDNIRDFEALRGFAKEKTGDFSYTMILSEPIRDGAGDAQGCRLSPQEIIALDIDSDVKQENGEIIRINDRQRSLPQPEGMFCAGGKCSYWLSWDGSMLLCSLMETPSASPFETGFSPAWQKLVSAVSSVKSPNDCKSCQYRNYCAVCPGRLYAETGSFTQCSPYICEIARLLYNKYQKNI